MMINLAIFVFCATASNQLFAGVPPAARLPIIKDLGAKPKPTVTPVLEATMFFPAHLAWTRNPDFMANDLFFAAMHAFEARIDVNANLIDTINALEAASTQGHYKPFHLLILSDSAAYRDSLYGYALLDGKSNEGLAYRAGNLRQFLAESERPLTDIVAPFTGEGKEELKSLDKDFKVFFTFAELKSGVLPPAKARQGAGRAARAISAASNARAEASRKRFNPKEAVPKFFENLTKNCEEAIQGIGFILHSASHRIRRKEEAAGNTPFPWDGFAFLTPNHEYSCNAASQDLAAFWSDFLTWTAYSLWKAQPDGYDGGRVPGDQRINDFLALSKCETSKDLLAMTPYVTEAWTYFNDNPVFMETLAAQKNPSPIGYQQSLRTVSSALRQFINALSRDINFGGAQNNFLTKDEAEEGKRLLLKVTGAFAFAQHALAALVLIEGAHIRERGSALHRTAVERALQKYGAALKSFARRTIMACDAQITLLENRPQLQKVFLLLKQLLLPFYKEYATPKTALTFVTNLKAHIAHLRPFFKAEDTFFLKGERDNIDGWMLWARTSLPLVGPGSHAYLSRNIDAIEHYCTGPSQNNAKHLLQDIAQRLPGQFTQTLEAFKHIKTLSGGLDEDHDAVFNAIYTGITSVLIDEVNYLIRKLYLLPEEYHTVIKRYENDGAAYAAVPTITRDIALARMKLYQYITENHTSIIGTRVIKEQDAALVELKDNIQYVIDNLEDEEVFTNEDIVNMNIGGEQGAGDPRDAHPGDTPIPDAEKANMNSIIGLIGHENIANITAGQRIALIHAVTPLLAREMQVIRHALLRHHATPSQRPAPFHRRPLNRRPQEGATPSQALTQLIELKARIEPFHPFFRTEYTFFSKGGRDNIGGWMQWARTSLPLVNPGLHAYLTQNIDAIESYCTGMARDNAKEVLRGIAQRPPGQFTQTRETFEHINTLSGGLDEDANAVFDRIRTGMTGVLIDEVNYLIHKLYLLPAEYHEVIKLYEYHEDYAAVPAITREIALARMKLYQYIAENHTSIDKTQVIKEQGDALVELKDNIQYVIDSLEGKDVFTDDDIVNMNIGGEQGAGAPRGANHPGDTPIPGVDRVRMNNIMKLIGRSNIATIVATRRKALIHAVTPLLAREMQVIRHALLRYHATPSQRPAPFHRRPAA